MAARGELPRVIVNTQESLLMPNILDVILALLGIPNTGQG